MSGVFIGNVASVNVITATLTPTIVATITSPEQTFTVPGLLVGDQVSVSHPSNVNGVGIAGARVSAANTLAIKFVNPTAGGVTPAAGAYLVTVVRPDAIGNTLIYS